jgi:hypothetical protein
MHHLCSAVPTTAHAVKHMLERNADGTVNFDVKPLVGVAP